MPTLFDENFFNTLLESKKPILNDETAFTAFSHAITQTPSSLFKQSELITSSLRTYELFVILRDFPVLGNKSAFFKTKLSLLLGVPTFKAKTKAAQYFFNPTEALNRQMYWCILTAAQVVFKSVRSSGKSLDMAKAYLNTECINDSFTIILREILTTYRDTFPALKEAIKTWRTFLEQETLTWYSLLSHAQSQCLAHTDSFEFAHSTLTLYPPSEHELLENTYTLENIERVAIEDEKNKYRAMAKKFFDDHPHEIEAFMRYFSSKLLESEKPNTEYISILIEELLNAPSLLSWDELGRAFMDYSENVDIQKILLEHGAFFSKKSNKVEDEMDWSFFLKTLAYYAPRSFQDAVFCEQMFIYANIKNHHDDRWSSLMRAMYKTKELPNTSFFDNAYGEALNTKKFYRRDSRLLKMSAQCHAFSSERLHAQSMRLSELENYVLPSTRFLAPKPNLAQYVPPETENAHNIFHWMDTLPDASFDALNLNALDFSDNKAMVLFNRLKSHRGTLEKLSVDEQNLSVKGDNSFRVKEYFFQSSTPLFRTLYRELMFFTALEKIDFKRCSLNDVAFSSLLTPLSRMRHLKHLNFSTNFLTDSSIKIFCTYHKGFKALKTIDFSTNFLTNEGAKYLLEKLAQFPSLTHVFFGGNSHILPVTAQAWVSKLNERVSESEQTIRLSVEHLQSTRDSYRETMRLNNFFQEKSLAKSTRAGSDEGLTSHDTQSTVSRSMHQKMTFIARDTATGFFSDKSESDDFISPSIETLTQFNNSIIDEELDISVGIYGEIKPADFLAFKSCLNTCNPMIKSFNFSGQRFEKAHFSALVQVLKRFILMDQIIADDLVVVDTNHAVVSKLILMTHLIEQLPSIQSLSFLGETEIKGNDAKRLLSAVQKSRSLTELALTKEEHQIFGEIKAVLFERLKSTLSVIDEDTASQSRNSAIISDILDTLPIVAQANDAPQDFSPISDVVNGDSNAALFSFEISYQNPTEHYKPLAKGSILKHYVVVCKRDNEPIEAFFVDNAQTTALVMPLTRNVERIKGTSAFKHISTLSNDTLKIPQLTAEDLKEVQAAFYHDESEVFMQIIPHQTREIVISLDKNFDAYMKEQKKSLFGTAGKTREKRARFFNYLVQGLMARLSPSSENENSALSAGLDLADIAGTALIPTFFVKPIVSAITQGLRKLNAIERTAFLRHIFNFNATLDSNSQSLKKLLDCLACMITARFIAQFNEYELNLNTANNIIDTIIDFIGFGNTLVYPILVKMDFEEKFLLKKVDRLMYQLFESPVSYFVTLHRNWLQCMEALDSGVKINNGESLPTHLGYATFYPNHICYVDVNLNPLLRDIEQHFRQALLNAMDNYHKKYHDLGYYGRYFVRYVKFHGGNASIEKTNALENDIKNKPFLVLLESFSSFLDTSQTHSRLHKYSLSTLIIDFLVGNINEESLNMWNEKMALIVSELAPDRVSTVSTDDRTSERDSLLSRGSLFSENQRKKVQRKISSDLEPFKREEETNTRRTDGSGNYFNYK